MGTKSGRGSSLHVYTDKKKKKRIKKKQTTGHQVGVSQQGLWGSRAKLVAGAAPKGILEQPIQKEPRAPVHTYQPGRQWILGAVLVVVCEEHGGHSRDNSGDFAESTGRDVSGHHIPLQGPLKKLRTPVLGSQIAGLEKGGHWVHKADRAQASWA